MWRCRMTKEIHEPEVTEIGVTSREVFSEELYQENYEERKRLGTLEQEAEGREEE